jgi:hypothetical protein
MEIPPIRAFNRIVGAPTAYGASGFFGHCVIPIHHLLSHFTPAQ